VRWQRLILALLQFITKCKSERIVKSDYKVIVKMEVALFCLGLAVYTSSFCGLVCTFLDNKSYNVWLNGLVLSTLGIRARGPGFDSRVVPLFRWVATLGKLFTHIAFPVFQLQETGVQKRSFRCLSGYRD